MGFFEWALAWYVFGVVSWLIFHLTEGRLTVGDVVIATFVGPTGPMLPAIIGMFYFVRVVDVWMDVVLWEKKT